MQSSFALTLRLWALAALMLGVLTLESLPANAEPKLAESTPPDGSVLEAPPDVVRLCFSEAVKAEEENWKFTMRAGQRALGLRIVFGSDGTCVDIFPGAGDTPPEGIWALDWLVRAQADASEETGVVRFQVGELQPGETPLPEPRDEGGTASDDDSPTALVALAAVGGAIVALSIIGFAVRRLRRRGGSQS